VGIQKNLEIVKSTWKLTFRTLCGHPRILFPFFITALSEIFFLTLFYYAPRPPLLSILGPPIRKFVGEAYLHYPANFALLPTLFYYGQVFVWLTVGVCMLGVAVNMINQVHEGRPIPSIIGSFNRAIRRYPALFLFALLIFLLSMASFRIPRFLIMKFYFLPRGKFFSLQAFFFVSFLIAIVIETFLVYGIPSCLIERRSFIGALKRTLKISKEMFVPTFILVLIPRLLDLIIAFLKQKLPLIMAKTFPDITLFILGAGIAVIFVTDLIVIASATNLFLIKKDAEGKTIEH
jgi:hypothetical protein